MLGNYIKISSRHLWHNKLYSIINLVGLAVAISCVLLAVLFIKDEQSFDRFHEKRENLYRILTTRTDDKGNRGTVAGTGQPQGPAFKAAVPEIVDYVRVLGGDIRGDVIANNKTFNVQMLFADESFSKKGFISSGETETEFKISFICSTPSRFFFTFSIRSSVARPRL